MPGWYGPLATRCSICWTSFIICYSALLIAHYGDVIMGTTASQITRLAIVFSTVYLDTYQRKHQSSAALAIVWGIHRGSVNSPHKWPVKRKMFPFDDVIMMVWFYDYTSETVVKTELEYLNVGFKDKICLGACATPLILINTYFKS